jgi:L-serine dehydratase
MGLPTSVSLFNDVIGPVMRGPSSSHTAGAYRIARVARALVGEELTAAHCAFDPEGSYARTFRPLGVDRAFCAGLLAWEMTDDRYESSVAAVRGAGIDVAFSVDPLENADHPNTVRIDLAGRSGTHLRVRARSTGGGAIDVTEVDGWAIRIDGRAWDLVLWTSAPQLDLARALCRETAKDGVERACHVKGDRALLHWQSLHGVDTHAVAQRAAGIDDLRFAVSPPLFDVQVGPGLFASASEALEVARARECSLGVLSLWHEMSLFDRSELEVVAEASRRYEVMKRAIEIGRTSSAIAMPLTEPSAANVLAAERTGGLPLGGPQTRAAARALAVMHVCNSQGVVCAAPTGGSAGVLPGVLSVLEEEGIADEAMVLRALLAAAGIGVIVASRGTFAAEIAGCQVEIGVAGAMAAAAVVEAAGGTAGQAVDAASIALQNTMGSVCDPVGGGCEIPCHTRNAAAASSAFTIADLVVGGYANPIPLDEAIDASLAVGRSLPAELRCTARGGLAITPSARRLCDLRRHQGAP